MPSSSSGQSHQERVLKHIFSSLSAHIYYHTTFLSPRIPHTISHSLQHHSHLVPHQIASLYTLLLDRDPSSHATGIDRVHALELRGLVRADAGVEDTLSGIVEWLECLARFMHGAGRQGGELEHVTAVVRAAERWRSDAAKALAGIRRKEERMRERVEMQCQRLGV